jgi:hypothetical protein
MLENETAIIVARVDNFDPNRPDLNEFLNSLVVKAMKEETRARKPKKAGKKNGRPVRFSRSQGRH